MDFFHNSKIDRVLDENVKLVTFSTQIHSVSFRNTLLIPGEPILYLLLLGGQVRLSGQVHFEEGVREGAVKVFHHVGLDEDVVGLVDVAGVAGDVGAAVAILGGVATGDGELI